MSAWKSRWSWVRFVNRASSKRTASTRCRASACEETSMTQARSPPCSMRRKVRCRSIASGVVRSTSSSTAPTTCLTVPSSPDWIAAASSTSRSRKAVVVLPFVPVIPATRRSAVGSPLNRAAIGAIAARASATTIWGTSSSSSRSTTSAAAPLSTAAPAYSCPSALPPTTQKKRVPGSTTRLSKASPAISTSGGPCTRFASAASISSRRLTTAGYAAPRLTLSTRTLPELAFADDGQGGTWHGDGGGSGDRRLWVGPAAPSHGDSPPSCAARHAGRIRRRSPPVAGRRRARVGLFGRDAEVREGEGGDLAEGGRGDRAAVVVAALGLVDDHRDQQARVLGGGEADEGGDEFRLRIRTVFGDLGRPRLAGERVSGNADLRRRSAGAEDALEHRAHLARDLLADHPPSLRPGQRLAVDLL